MALRPDQIPAELNKLYKPRVPAEFALKLDNLSPNIWIGGGAIDIYVSNSATQPTALSQMTLSNATVSAIQEFEVLPLPTYMAFVQKTPTVNELVCTMMSLEDLGSIS